MLLPKHLIRLVRSSFSAGLGKSNWGPLVRAWVAARHASGQYCSVGALRSAQVLPRRYGRLLRGMMPFWTLPITRAKVRPPTLKQVAKESSNR